MFKKNYERGEEFFYLIGHFRVPKKSHFQNEAKCETFVVKMSFICIIMKTHFHINAFALSLALKVRFFGTRKWPIYMLIDQKRPNLLKAQNVLTADRWPIG